MPRQVYLFIWEKGVKVCDKSIWWLFEGLGMSNSNLLIIPFSSKRLESTDNLMIILIHETLFASYWTKTLHLQDKTHPGQPKPRLFTVGRLDVATTGLIIVTNDGMLYKLLLVASVFRIAVKKGLELKE